MNHTVKTRKNQVKKSNIFEQQAMIEKMEVIMNILKKH